MIKIKKIAIFIILYGLFSFHLKAFSQVKLSEETKAFLQFLHGTKQHSMIGSGFSQSPFILSVPKDLTFDFYQELISSVLSTNESAASYHFDMTITLGGSNSRREETRRTQTPSREETNPKDIEPSGGRSQNKYSDIKTPIGMERPMSDTIDRNISEQTIRAGGSPASIQRNFLQLHSSKISQSKPSSELDREWFARHYENAQLTSSAVSSGVLVGSLAYEMYQSGDQEFGSIFKDIALETFKLASEIAVEYPPAIGTAIGFFEASSGVDLPYGDELTVLERGLSFVGAIAGTVPGGKSFVTLASKFFKGLSNASTRLAKHAPLQYGKLSEFAHHAFKIVESAKSIGWHADDIKRFLKAPSPEGEGFWGLSRNRLNISTS